jgi:putative chitinase
MAIDRALFAQECVRQGVFFRIEPHYMLGAAQLRSGIADDSNGNEIGPFRLTQAEWDANCHNDEFDVHFTSAEVTSWRRQCVVFGFMAHRVFEAFVAANNGRNPSAIELYLQQRPGATSATLATDFQTALDNTAALVDPAADVVLDDPQSVSAIDNSNEPVTGPLKKLSPELVPPMPGGPGPAPGGPAPGGPAPDGPAAGPGLLTLAMLQRHWGAQAVPGLIQGMANTAGVLNTFGINTPLRLAHFMAQISAESGNGHFMRESLNYSAGRMMQVFPRRFPDLASTAGFANNERAFGNKVYNGRMGNRVGTDDGFNFRGRGCLQITGRDNYNALGKSCGLPLVDNPDLAIDPRNVLLIAATEFVKLGCLQECDRDDVVQVSARVNLGHRTKNPRSINGLAARRQQLAIWRQEFGA